MHKYILQSEKKQDFYLKKTIFNGNVSFVTYKVISKEE